MNVSGFEEVGTQGQLLAQFAAQSRSPAGVSPAALAAGDLDGDGAADLVASRASASDGLLTVYRRVAHSNSAMAPGTSFEEVGTFELPEAPSFVELGDFDADGKTDVVAAAQGSRTLYWLPGDGRGGFGDMTETRLSGEVAALVAGDVGRRDGLRDVVVGVEGTTRAELLIFESPEGARLAEPEVVALPGEPSAVAVGQLDGSYPVDLAVAAGGHLLIIHGRDRRLTSVAAEREAVPPAVVETVDLPFEVVSLALGDFHPQARSRTDLAVLTMSGEVQVLSQDLESDGSKRGDGARGWKVVSGSASALNLKALDRSIPKQRVLTTLRISSLKGDELAVVGSDSGAVELLLFQRSESGLGTRSAVGSRHALPAGGRPVAVLPLQINGDALDDLVVLRSDSVRPAVALTQPAHVFVVNTTADVTDCDLEDDVCSDGVVDPETLECELNGVCGLNGAIQQANASAGADLIAFQIAGGGAPAKILRSSLSNPILEAVTIDGTTQNCAEPPCVELASGTVPSLEIVGGRTAVRGLAVHASNTSIQVRVGGSNVLEANHIGTDLSGTLEGGGSGVGISSPGNRVGGPETGQGNLIVGGVGIGGESASWNEVQGNLIQSASSVESCVGVNVSDAQNNTIGGPSAGAGNVISGCGSGSGIVIASSVFLPGRLTSGNLVQGNLIGLDASGTAAAPFGFGVQVAASATGNAIGGIAPGAGNVISGNEFDNQGSGIFLNRAVDTLVQGNAIGTTIDTKGAVGNDSGVVVRGTRNLIGGTAAGAGNVISGNRQAGVSITGDDFVTARGNLVLGNRIGTDSSGTVSVPNTLGVYIRRSEDNHIGGGTPGAGNVIAHNTGPGVAIESGAGNKLQGNSIFANGQLGIDLAPAGVTANDPGDADTGANDLQNYPVLRQALSASDGTVVEGSLSTAPETTVRIDLFANPSCDGTGFGEGERFVDSFLLTTNSFGNAAFSRNVPARGSFTATATSSSGNTSEFSNCLSDGGSSLCGNGRVEPGEQCDDGNTQSGDCCSTLCQFEPTGSPCDDHNACTVEGSSSCDGAGRCVGGAEVNCNDGANCTSEFCDSSVGCVYIPEHLSCRDDDDCTVDICVIFVDCVSVLQDACDESQPPAVLDPALQTVPAGSVTVPLPLEPPVILHFESTSGGLLQGQAFQAPQLPTSVPLAPLRHQGAPAARGASAGSELQTGVSAVAPVSDPWQIWYLEYDGVFAPTSTVVFGYDESTLLAGVRETQLRIFQLIAGEWMPLESVVDTGANTLEVNPGFLSLFALGRLNVLFQDGFERGDVSAWKRAAP